MQLITYELIDLLEEGVNYAYASYITPIGAIVESYNNKFKRLPYKKDVKCDYKYAVGCFSKSFKWTFDSIIKKDLFIANFDFSNKTKTLHVLSDLSLLIINKNKSELPDRIIEIAKDQTVLKLIK